MNPATAPMEISITSIAMTMAVTMTESSLAIPTAVITESRENTMSSARISPIRRATACWRAGRRPVRIAMNTTLSTPRTISRAASVASATRPSAVSSASIVGGILPQCVRILMNRAPPPARCARAPRRARARRAVARRGARCPRARRSRRARLGGRGQPRGCRGRGAAGDDALHRHRQRARGRLSTGQRHGEPSRLSLRASHRAGARARHRYARSGHAAGPALRRARRCVAARRRRVRAAVRPARRSAARRGLAPPRVVLPLPRLPRGTGVERTRVRRTPSGQWRALRRLASDIRGRPRVGVVSQPGRRLPGGRLVRVLGVLALAGGATLFFHFHDGRIHFDWIYLQHAVMGSTALGIGVALLVGTRTARVRPWLVWAWPVFLTVMATVLLFYREG